MPYLFKQKLNIGDFSAAQVMRKKILIHEPENYLSQIYVSYFRQQNFDVRRCPDLKHLSDHAKSFSPDLLVCSLEAGGSGEWLINFKQFFRAVSVVTIGFDTGSDTLKKLMAAGCSGHLNRRLSRPQDLVDIVKTILY